MAKNSKIEWTDHTFNPWIGCTKVSPGCLHCYAERRDIRLAGGHWGKGAPRQLTSDANWRQPLKWAKTKHCTNCGEPAPWNALACGSRGCGHFEFRSPRAFCASLADWLDDEVPVEWLARLFDLIRRTPNLDWLLLTKRPQNWESRMRAVEGIERVGSHAGHILAHRWLRGDAPANVWVGTTVEDQTRANERIPHLLRIPAKVRFLSCEPLLGRLDISAFVWRRAAAREMPGYVLNDAPSADYYLGREGTWVICGGESGPGARPMHPDWARSLRDQADDAGVPFLFKQHGEWVGGQEDDVTRWRFQDGKFIDPHAFPDFSDPEWSKGWDFDLETATVFRKVGKKAAGRLLDGVEHNEFPKPREAAPTR